MKHTVFAIVMIFLAGNLMSACNSILPVSSSVRLTQINVASPTVGLTNTSTVTPLPSDTPTPTAIQCPPYPLLQDLSLPNDIAEFVGQYDQKPGKIEGIEGHWYSPIRHEDGIFKDKYIVSNPSMGEKHMLWLEKLICFTESHTYYQIVDVVALPNVTANDVVNLNTCLINGSLSPRIVGLGKMNNGSGELTEPSYAWKIDIKDEAIIPTKTENIECDFDMSYPQP